MWLRFHDKGPWFDFLAGFSGHFFRGSQLSGAIKNRSSQIYINR